MRKEVYPKMKETVPKWRGVVVPAANVFVEKLEKYLPHSFFFLQFKFWSNPTDKLTGRTFAVRICIKTVYLFIYLWLWWSLTTRQQLWVILCRLPAKGRKEIEEIVEEKK